MGYSAEVIDNRPAGPLAVIPKDRVELVWKGLEEAEDDNGTPGYHGHISWCDELVKYVGSTAEKVVEVLSDFGFDGGVMLDEDGDIVISYWGGDKLGMSWDAVLRAIAAGIDPISEYRWLLQGEDGMHWAEDFKDNTVTSQNVTLNW